MRSPSHFIKGGSRNHAENFIYFKFVVWEFHTWIWCVFFKSSQRLPFHSISVYNPTATAFSPDPMFSVWNSESTSCSCRQLWIHAVASPFQHLYPGGKNRFKESGRLWRRWNHPGELKGQLWKTTLPKKVAGRCGGTRCGVEGRVGQGGAGRGGARSFKNEVDLLGV